MPSNSPEPRSLRQPPPPPRVWLSIWRSLLTTLISSYGLLILIAVGSLGGSLGTRLANTFFPNAFRGSSKDAPSVIGALVLVGLMLLAVWLVGVISRRRELETASRDADLAQINSDIGIIEHTDRNTARVLRVIEHLLQRQMKQNSRSASIQNWLRSGLFYVAGLVSPYIIPFIVSLIKH